VNNTANSAPRFIQRRVLRIVFASTSGHTEYVVDALTDSLKSIAPDWEIGSDQLAGRWRHMRIS
jgi:hypothetical protein